MDSLVFTSAERLSIRANLRDIAEQLGRELVVKMLRKVNVLPAAGADSKWHKHIQERLEDDEFVMEVL
eukprot:9950786-Prorocentrum_lima.AAC.1